MGTHEHRFTLRGWNPATGVAVFEDDGEWFLLSVGQSWKPHALDGYATAFTIAVREHLEGQHRTFPNLDALVTYVREHWAREVSIPPFDVEALAPNLHPAAREALEQAKQRGVEALAQLFKYYAEAVMPSMIRGLNRDGIPVSSTDDLLSEVNFRLYRECAVKRAQGEPVDEEKLFLIANRTRKDVIAEFFRGQWKRREDPETSPAELQDSAANVLREVTQNDSIEEYQRRRDEIFANEGRYYARETPDLAAYDRKLVRLWERDPEASLREIGRILNKDFADTDVGRHTETYAAYRLKLFLDRVRELHQN